MIHEGGAVVILLRFGGVMAYHHGNIIEKGIMINEATPLNCILNFSFHIHLTMIYLKLYYNKKRFNSIMHINGFSCDKVYILPSRRK